MDTAIRQRGRRVNTVAGRHRPRRDRDQMVVERKIAAEEGKTRHDYGRDAFIDKSGSGKRNPAAPLHQDAPSRQLR